MTPFPVAILAGGMATRLRPVTESIPKALFEIRGEPFIAHQLRLLRLKGFERVVLLTGYRGEMIRDVVEDGRAYALTVSYSSDWPQLLGTAGAVKKALGLLGEAFHVLYGDSYLTCDYAAVHEAFEASGKKALMTVYRNEDQHDRSNVEMEGGRILAYDKEWRTPRMKHIDYGLGVFRRAAFDNVPDGVRCDLSTVYRSMLEQGELAAFEVKERFYEVGSFQGIEELEKMLTQSSTEDRP